MVPSKITADRITSYPYRSLPKIVLGFALGQAEEEDLEADEPEGGEQGVVHHVEGRDLQPGHRGPGEDLTRFRIEDHVPIHHTNSIFIGTATKRRNM